MTKMIKVQNLTKIYRTPIKSGNPLRDFFARQYKQSIALDNISFKIGENELVGLIGPNGAGKTTTMKILSGILYPTGGDIKVLGYTPSDKKPEFLRQIAFVMGQKNQLVWELPATDAFELTRTVYGIDKKHFRQTVDNLCELLNCSSFINQPVKTLSLGQRMRVELINSLIHRPKILFLDEPTIGLDIFAQTTIINFIKEYQERYQSTIILTSHYMQDVQRLAKRVIIINHGRIIFDGQLTRLISKYSQEKTVNIILNHLLPEKFHLPDDIKCQYDFPTLKLNVRKEDIASILAYLLKEIEFNDVTIEDEPIEEVIKKIFTSSQNKESRPK